MTIDCDWYFANRASIVLKKWACNDQSSLNAGGTSHDSSDMSVLLIQWRTTYHERSFLRAGSIARSMCACCDNFSAIDVNDICSSWNNESSSFHHTLKYSRFVVGESWLSITRLSSIGDMSGLSYTENLMCLAERCHSLLYFSHFLILSISWYM